MVIDMNADSALRELVEKWREIGAAADRRNGETDCGVAFAQCAAELESILTAAGEAQGEPFAYFIDGPGGFWTCYKKDQIELQIAEHCGVHKEDAEDYTATAMFLHPYQPTAPSGIPDDHLDGEYAAPAVMVLVPREPTGDMYDEGEREIAFGNDFSDAWKAAIAAAPAAQVVDIRSRAAAEQFNWQSAVLDALANTCQDFPIGTTPKTIIDAVIAWHVKAALDPAVSSEAAALLSAAPAVVVDEAMVERATGAYRSEIHRINGHHTYWGPAHPGALRAALAAALSQGQN